MTIEARDAKRDIGNRGTFYLSAALSLRATRGNPVLKLARSATLDA